MEAWLTALEVGLAPVGYEYLDYILRAQFAIIVTVTILDMLGRFLNSIMKGGQ